jgi:hypothetical protein
MAVRLTQPLTEMGTKMFLGSGARPAREADNLTVISERLSSQCGIINISQL